EYTPPCPPYPGRGDPPWSIHPPAHLTQGGGICPPARCPHTVWGGLQALRETLEQKELERGHLASLCALAQDAWRRQDQTRALALTEMEALVAALQAALASSTKDLEVLAESLGAPAPGLLRRL
ncbi:rootletin-like, partial [Chelydra serpentina]